jgi:sulfur-oxidizing protein SoxY
MHATRRVLLKAASASGLVGLAATAGLLTPTRVLAVWNQAAFTASKPDQAIAAINGENAAASEKITIKAPDIAENGAVVPVEVSTTLENLESIALLGEKNANPLVGVYVLNNCEGLLSTRIKMGQTANIRAIVRAGGKVYTATREVKVTAGGCGG